MNLLISLIASIIILLLIAKLIEIGLDLRWVIYHGKNFADELLAELPGIYNSEHWKNTWEKLEIKHKRTDFFISKLLKKFIQESKYRLVRKISKIIQVHIFRGSRLIISQSLIVPLFVLFNKNDELYCFIYLNIIIVVLIFGLILKTIFLLFNNLKMGFVNNFHLSILSQLDKHGKPKFVLSIREILTRFLAIFGRNLIGVIIGFAGIYTALYLIDTLKFFKGIEASSPFFVWLEFIYYSIVTITTTGYGDIDSVHWISRITSSLELILGLTFIIVLILAFQVTHSHKKVIP